MAALDTTAISRPREPDLVQGYRLEKLVGKGGMGEVHRAVQLSLGRTVAVKLLAVELASDSAFVARFDKEAAALASLSHPNVVSIVDKGKSGATYYLVMEFVDGPSLREVMRSPLLDVPGTLRIMMEICRAIDYAHGRGVVHRDLKPENILFDEQAGGLAKVSDFGLASFLDNAASKYNVTETHVSMGTLAYMAPEQRVDAKSADHRADVYSLGVMLYEMLVGELPIGSYDPPSRRKTGVDKRLDAIVARCLKPIPEDRYQKVSELIADLEPLVPLSFTQASRKTSALERIQRRVRSAVRRTLRAVAWAVVLASAVVLGLAFLRDKYKPVARGPTTATLMGELPGTPHALTGPGKLLAQPDRRRFSLEEGPDTLPFVAAGRAVSLEPSGSPGSPLGGGLVYPAGREEANPGRVTLDVVDVEGLTASVSAGLTATSPPSTFFSHLKTAALGSPLEPRAALLLVGELGHYAGLVVGNNGTPMMLEWALGERRGAMLGPPSPAAGTAPGGVPVRLSVDRRGELRAEWMTEREWHTIGEPVELGPEWHRLFGRAPTPAFGCLEGVCRAQGLIFEVGREPPPPLTPLSEATSKEPGVEPAAVLATPPMARPGVAVKTREPGSEHHLPARRLPPTAAKKPAPRPLLPVKKHR